MPNKTITIYPPVEAPVGDKCGGCLMRSSDDCVPFNESLKFTWKDRYIDYKGTKIYEKCQQCKDLCEREKKGVDKL